MFEFKTLENNSVLTGIISKGIFNALAEGKTTIINTVGEKEKIDEIKSFSKDGPHIKFEGRENFIEVGFFPCEDQNHKKIGLSEIFLSKKDLEGIEKKYFYPIALEIFEQDYLKSFGKYIPEQFIKIKIKSIEQEGL